MSTPTIDELRIDGRSPALAGQLLPVFRRWGCAIVEGLFSEADLSALRSGISELVSLALREANQPAMGSEDGLVRLAEAAPEWVDAVFAGGRRLAAVHQLSVHPRLLQLSKQLMDTDLIMCPPYKPVRIDFAAREGALLPWHQDYPYAQDSPDSVVYWIPLQDVDEQNGCLQVAPGSHALGVIPVEMIEPPPESTHGIRGLRIADPSVVEPFSMPRVPMRLGDVLVLHTFLLHRSCVNRSTSARLTVQVRHGNFRNPTAIQKKWPRGHYERHWFDETHPESIA